MRRECTTRTERTTEVARIGSPSRRELTGDVVLVRLSGEADLHTAPLLRDALDQAIETEAETLVVDLGGVTFVDSMMLGVLLGTTRRMAERGMEMRIVVDDPHVLRIFELTLLDRVLRLYPTLELAVEPSARVG